MAGAYISGWRAYTSSVCVGAYTSVCRPRQVPYYSAQTLLLIVNVSEFLAAKTRSGEFSV